MKKLVPLTLLAVALGSAALAHEGHDHATGVVKERMITMTSLGEHLLTISKRLRANKELDKIAEDARVIQRLAGTIAKQFPPGSTQSPTAARPAIWQEWATFESNAKKLEAEADKLVTTDVGDRDGLRAQFRAVAYACDGCHETFRVPNKK
jgi:cytochrome c556